MEISEIRVKLTDDPRNKLKAYCSVTFHDEFVIRDLKIIEGSKGPFVAMPSRKLADHCPHCGCKNHLRAAFCNQCGKGLNADRAPRDERGRARLHADLAHPINSACRIDLHRSIVRAFQEEVERSQQEGYKQVSFDDFDDLAEPVDDGYIEELQARQEVRNKDRTGPQQAPNQGAPIERQPQHRNQGRAMEQGA